MNKTKFFTDFLSDNENSGNLPKITPNRVFYSVDDCIMAQDCEKMDTDKVINNLQETFGDHLGKYVNTSAQYYDQQIPVITYEEYLKEMKDLIQTGAEKKGTRPVRFYVDLAGGLSVGSVIILNKYRDNYVLINEVYKEGTFVKAMEYNFYDVIKMYQQIQSEE